MEIEIVILILGVVSVTIIGALYYNKGNNPVKKAQKRNESSLFDNLTEYREVEKGTILDILKQKDNQIKSLNARIKAFEPEQEEDPTQKGVSWEEITALANQSYPKYAPLLPLLKDQIMKATKGMSMEEILGYVKQLTGNQQPKGQIDPQSAEYNPNWA